MSSTSDNELFTVLPEGTRIPSSQVRVVAMHRSRNVATPQVTGGETARAHLVAIYSLRGTYTFFVHMELGGGKRILLGGPHLDVAVAHYKQLEEKALAWLSSQGFEMVMVEFSTLPLTERHAILMGLPFAQSGDDLTQGVAFAPVAPDKSAPCLEEVFGELEAIEVLNRLLSLLRAG